MSSTEIILGLGALIISVLTYFAGVHRGELKARQDEKREQVRMQQDEKREQVRMQQERIRRVLDKYIENEQARYASGFHGLIISGVNSLENDFEIRTVCREIESRGLKSPFGRRLNFDGIDLYNFFSLAEKRGYDFLKNGNPEELVMELKNN